LSNVLSEIGGSRIAQIYAAVWDCTLTAAREIRLLRRSRTIRWGSV
jgi:hypothetical protein